MSESMSPVQFQLGDCMMSKSGLPLVLQLGDCVTVSEKESSPNGLQQVTAKFDIPAGTLIQFDPRFDISFASILMDVDWVSPAKFDISYLKQLFTTYVNKWSFSDCSFVVINGLAMARATRFIKQGDCISVHLGLSDCLTLETLLICKNEEIDRTICENLYKARDIIQKEMAHNREQFLIGAFTKSLLTHFNLIEL